jgi:hypothetical protein
MTSTQDRCPTPMRHADKSVSQCVLDRAHVLQDSDHVDKHGHHAPVLVSQATIREVDRVAAASNDRMVRLTVQADVPDSRADDLVAELKDPAWKAVGYSYRAPGTPFSPPDRNWRKLYDWLGEQVVEGKREARENEHAANLDRSVGPRYMADAYREARAEMRRMDSTLPRGKVRAS